ncbi:hypothetical protein R3W88_018966 [Solanum pinnatisectum]|uniref:60S acidic ribosomal protein P2 n=1 Tax=Solanum pinnatisectum TaxID=50273 RepID=A0AAV9KKH5_9SOLN|nr:hypothetical protein R3W88_018966 [Solanum pinnatisectum]
MKVIAAYLLAQLGDNSNPSSNDLKKILNSVSAEIDDLIATGKQRLASTTCMSFGSVDGATNNNNDDDDDDDGDDDNDNANVDGQVIVEEKKEEKKVEKVEESDEDFNFSLFD